ncbi:hypothetical protein LSAT2_023527 [Lamellibrachia satsuma]|nr:hypothetical protein LSAT2_023527 [Lamellibrachia satsuma]
MPRRSVIYGLPVGGYMLGPGRFLFSAHKYRRVFAFPGAVCSEVLERGRGADVDGDRDIVRARGDTATLRGGPRSRERNAARHENINTPQGQRRVIVT